MHYSVVSILFILIGSQCVLSTSLIPGLAAFCKVFKKADIMLLVSDSRNTMRYRWMAPIISPGVTTFISNFLFSLDCRNVRVGIMAFSDTARLVAPFSRSPTVARQRMMFWRPQFRSTKTYRGINAARRYFKSYSSPSCKKIILLLIDNNSDNYAMTRQQVDLAKSEDITLITIGYSRPFSQLTELRAMSDEDDDDDDDYNDDFFWTPNDILLSGLLPKILKVLCSVINGWPTLPPTSPTTPTPGKIGSDLVMILDDSESTRKFDGISISYDSAMVDFVKQVALQMENRPCRLAVVMVSTTGRLIFNFGSILSDINTAMDTFTPEFNTTRTSRGYDVARQLLVTSQTEQVAKFGPSSLEAQSQYVLLVADGINFDDDESTDAPFQLIPSATFGLFLLGTSFHGPAATSTNIVKALQNSSWYLPLEDSTGLRGKAVDVANFVCMKGN